MAEQPTRFFTSYWNRSEKTLPRVLTEFGSRKAAKEAAQAYAEDTGFACSVGYYNAKGLREFEGRYRVEKKHGVVYRPFGG